MAPFEYLLLFASVILGLAACELAIGLNRLLGNWSRVRWDWLAPLAALLTFLKLVTQWWSWHGVVSLASGVTFEMYLAVLISAVILFMMAAASLPGPLEGDEPVDLRGHYARVSRRYWLLFTLHFALAVATGVWLQTSVNHGHVELLSPALLLLPVGLILAVWRNRILHLVGLIGLNLLYFLYYFGQPLP